MKNFLSNLASTTLGALIAVAFFVYAFPSVVSPAQAPALRGSSVLNPYGYRSATEATSSVGTSPVVVLAAGSWTTKATVTNQSSTVAWCWSKATTTNVVAYAGQPIVQYGSYQFDQTDPYYGGGVTCVTGSGTTTLSITYQ